MWDARWNYRRHESCQLFPVPEHGDLIDRDAFVKELEYDIELVKRTLDGMECVGKDREILLLDKICKDNSIRYLSEAPVVIPASEKENMLSHKIEVKGNCTACGKPLGENDGLFLCAECQKKQAEEAE